MSLLSEEAMEVKICSKVFVQERSTTTLSTFDLHNCTKYTRSEALGQKTCFCSKSRNSQGTLCKGPETQADIDRVVQFWIFVLQIGNLGEAAENWKWKVFEASFSINMVNLYIKVIARKLDLESSLKVESIRGVREVTEGPATSQTETLEHQATPP